VAYTWQRTLARPADVPEPETLLVTADPDGRNRRVRASRKVVIGENRSGRAGVVWFFWVVNWR
jgi:hypothetical protein